MSVNPYSFPHDSYLAFFLNATPPPPSHSSGNEMQLSPVICSIFFFFYHYGRLLWLMDLNPYVLSEVCSFGVKSLGASYEISQRSLGFVGKQREISDRKQWRV